MGLTERRFVVYSVFTVELFQTLTLTIVMWNVFVSGYGQFDASDKTTWPSWVAPVLSGIGASHQAPLAYIYSITWVLVSTTVQVFFAWYFDYFSPVILISLADIFLIRRRIWGLKQTQITAAIAIIIVLVGFELQDFLNYNQLLVNVTRLHLCRA